jgi:hypothetical protein
MWNWYAFLKAIKEIISDPDLVPRPNYDVPVATLKMNKSNAQTLYETAASCLGQAIAPTHLAELGCAIVVNRIYKKAFGTQIVPSPNDSSTLSLYMALENGNFDKVTDPLPGDIIISPTSLGNGKIPHGHTGIVAKYGILSNDSFTGTFRENFTLQGWKNYYVDKGGYPQLYYRPRG